MVYLSKEALEEMSQWLGLTKEEIKEVLESAGKGVELESEEYDD